MEIDTWIEIENWPIFFRVLMIRVPKILNKFIVVVLSDKTHLLSSS